MKPISLLLSSILMSIVLLNLGFSHRVFAQAEPTTPAPSAPSPTTEPTAPTSPVETPPPSSPTETPAPTSPVENPPPSSPTPTGNPDSGSSEFPGTNPRTVLAICGHNGASQIFEANKVRIGCYLVPTDSVPAGQV
jgi:cytoskeletal protein RodZ